MYQLSEIRAKVEELAKLIGANQHQVPTYGKSRDFGYSHVEVDEVSYHLVTVERGQELERKSTTELDELLYYIFVDATSDIAGNFELKNRIEDQDSRRIAFSKQIELMHSINSDFGQKVELYLSKILEKYPYDDELIKKLNQSSGA
jgi:hypothetical protein